MQSLSCQKKKQKIYVQIYFDNDLLHQIDTFGTYIYVFRGKAHIELSTLSLILQSSWNELLYEKYFENVVIGTCVGDE